MVHVGWTAGENGTLLSHEGAVAHVGQFFFPEEWNDQVFALAPYTLNTNRRTLNRDDWIFEEAGAGGNNALIECVLSSTKYMWVLIRRSRLEMIGDKLEDGLRGYVSEYCFDDSRHELYAHTDSQQWVWTPAHRTAS